MNTLWLLHFSIFCCSFHIPPHLVPGTVFATAAASLNFLHSLRCPPCFQWFTWHSRPQYCTVWHNLQGCNGRKGVFGLPQVEQQRMVGVVRPSCLSNI